MKKTILQMLKFNNNISIKLVELIYLTILFSTIFLQFYDESIINKILVVVIMMIIINIYNIIFTSITYKIIIKENDACRYIDVFKTMLVLNGIMFFGDMLFKNVTNKYISSILYLFLYSAICFINIIILKINTRKNIKWYIILYILFYLGLFIGGVLG